MLYYKTAIFDLDGTLLDTLDDLASASNQVLAQCNRPQHPRDAYRYFVGDGLRTLMERILPPDVPQQEVEHCCSLFEQIYGQGWALRTKPYPGIEHMLAQLQQQGVRVAILSNKPHQFTTACVAHFFTNVDFSPVFGVREGVQKKPDPAGALEIARIHDTPPGNCLYIGDTSVDMRTGKSAGMYTIGVTWGFRPSQELIDNGADLIVSSPEEIVRHAISAN